MFLANGNSLEMLLSSKSWINSKGAAANRIEFMALGRGAAPMKFEYPGMERSINNIDNESSLSRGAIFSVNEDMLETPVS